MNRLDVISLVLSLAVTTAPAHSGQGVSCASLIVVDGDTIKCDGQNMRL
ncbi:hypothetical protein [Agrobacterium tumefaciens]|nr:hypothetical protein [Agrobacterium tumefaciens]NTD09575.1 hypothetical protein [Agrobacterium tumefaciens]